MESADNLSEDTNDNIANTRKDEELHFEDKLCIKDESDPNKLEESKELINQTESTQITQANIKLYGETLSETVQQHLVETGTEDTLTNYLEILSNCTLLRREISAMSDADYRGLNDKIIKTMDMKISEVCVPKLLAEILSDAEVFVKEKNFPLLELLIDTLKKLLKKDKSSLEPNQITATQRQEIIDFLYRFKDIHPFSGSDWDEGFDIFDMLMEFLIPLGLLPSPSLFKEYEQSTFTEELNKIPGYNYLNNGFQGFSKEKYEIMKERLSSRPPFVYFFNPSIKTRYLAWSGSYYEGFLANKGQIDQIGAGLYIDDQGLLYQGYFKNDRFNVYGRKIDYEHNIYEGGYSQGYEWGYGETEYYQDGRIEKGYKIHDRKRGEFECIYKDGTVVKETFRGNITGSSDDESESLKILKMKIREIIRNE